MAAKVMWEKSVPRNSGFAFEMQAGQLVRVGSWGVTDFVAFNRANLRERFDQARTKANQRKFYLTVGDVLVSKLNNTLMTIVEDQFKTGHHDLQSGGCSKKRFDLVRNSGELELTYGRPIKPEDVPTHGCWENLSNALQPWGIAPEDVPSPFNIFQDMRIDGVTGSMEHSNVRPKNGETVTLRAEMGLLIALSVCPDMIEGGTKGGTVALLAADA